MNYIIYGQNSNKTNIQKLYTRLKLNNINIYIINIYIIMTYSIILHGGAGESLKNIIDDPNKLLELEKLYTTALKKILQYGIKLLKDGKPAIEVVEKCCIKLENNELFNAGVGATKNIENKIFHDAIIIDGKTKNWGAICNSNIVKNPIKRWKQIMNK